MAERKRFKDLKKKAILMIAKGATTREVAAELGVGKTTTARWFKEFSSENHSSENKDNEVEQVAQIIKSPKPEIRINDRYAQYIDSLRTVKNRQSKWAGAITETGIRSLKLANQYLAIAETKTKDGENISQTEMNLIKLIPSLMSTSASAIKSAAEAEDRAFSLDKLVETLHELPQQIKRNN